MVARQTLYAPPCGRRQRNPAELNFMFLTKSLRTKAAGMACLLLTLTMPAILAAFPAAAKVLATVNGKQITDDDTKIAADDLRGTLPPQLDGKAREIIGDNRICKVSVVGIGMRSHVGLASKMFKALADEGINIQMISTSEIKTSVVIDEKYLELAVRVLHRAFELDQASAPAESR